jgi:hypothetical protein
MRIQKQKGDRGGVCGYARVVKARKQFAFERAQARAECQQPTAKARGEARPEWQSAEQSDTWRSLVVEPFK